MIIGLRLSLFDPSIKLIHY